MLKYVRDGRVEGIYGKNDVGKTTTVIMEEGVIC